MSFLYSGICKEIEQKIRNGFYAPGTRIPSIAELRAAYQVSHITVLRVYRELEAHGLIDCIRGKGNFVRQTADAAAPKLWRIGNFVRTLRERGLEPGFFNQINAGIENGAVQYNFELLRSPAASAFNQFHFPESLLNEVYHAMERMEPIVDGFLVDAWFPESGVERMLKKLTKPMVIVNRATALPVSCVLNDDEQSVREVLNCARQTGFGKLLYIASLPEDAPPLVPYALKLKAFQEQSRSFTEVEIIDDFSMRPSPETQKLFRSALKKLLKTPGKVLIIGNSASSSCIARNWLEQSDFSQERCAIANLEGTLPLDNPEYQANLCTSAPDAYKIGCTAVELLANRSGITECVKVPPKFFLGKI